ncbi:hypothetical protein K456DRAFT_50443 [Colletotrichum gloeosporioides 23]|nr:hypothetical protein K456DRAFT_50443 [Colletotrichum gloeosporioides 23]
MESTLDNRLRDICASPFRGMHQDWRTSSTDNFSLRLGSASEVRGRTYCSLCRLVSQAISLRYDLPETENIEIRWLPGWKHFESRAFPRDTSIELVGEKVRILDNSNIDISRLRQWLGYCLEHHPVCSNAQPISSGGIPNFRAIDVSRKCIVPIPSDIKYMALSYIWGQVSTYRLLKNNIEDLMKSGGISRIWHNVPRTIKDAISLTEAIGEKYLWVDTLCLIQDDINNMIPGIKHMDLVYSGAFCTIVAACGGDANAGLPGVGSVPRCAQLVTGEVYPGTRLIVKHSMEGQMKNTPYDTRAWTFQEFFLSRRRIVFTGGQVYYLCGSVSWSDEDTKLHDYFPSSSETMLTDYQSEWMENNFATHDMFTFILWSYSTRKLTFESDIINGIDGICRALSIRYKCSFLQGMPVAALELFLLFKSDDTSSIHPYNFSATKSSKRRRGFPSYSWTGWCGRVCFFGLSSRSSEDIKIINDWLSSNNWIVWYKYETSTGAISRVWDVSQNTDSPEATENDIGYCHRRAFQFKNAASRLLCNNPTTEPSPHYRTTFQGQYSYPLLQFWTVSVNFKVSEPEESSSSQPRFDLLDRNGHYCGYVYQYHKEPTCIGIHEGTKIELILLSECWKVEDDDVSDDGKQDKHKYPSTGFYFKNYKGGDLFWALWIRWDGDVAERVAIAQIFQPAVEESLERGPVWKEILLG